MNVQQLGRDGVSTVTDWGVFCKSHTYVSGGSGFFGHILLRSTCPFFVQMFHFCIDIREFLSHFFSRSEQYPIHKI